MMEKFEISVGIIWFLSILFMPALIIMFVWGVDVMLIKKMLITNSIILVVLSMMMSILHRD